MSLLAFLLSFALQQRPCLGRISCNYSVASGTRLPGHILLRLVAPVDRRRGPALTKFRASGPTASAGSAPHFGASATRYSHVTAASPIFEFPSTHKIWRCRKIQPRTNKQDDGILPQVNMATTQAVQVFGKKKNATGTDFRLERNKSVGGL